MKSTWVVIPLGLVLLTASAAGAQGPPFSDSEDTVRVFLTRSVYKGDEVLAACPNGWRNAELWDFRDPHDVEYVYDAPDALPSGEDTVGALLNSFGWIRTNSALGLSFNCKGWSAREVDFSGTILGLTFPLAENPQDPVVSETSVLVRLQQLSCAADVRVWCAEE